MPIAKPVLKTGSPPNSSDSVYLEDHPRVVIQPADYAEVHVAVLDAVQGEYPEDLPEVVYGA
jgi:hypothetical protein